MDDKIALFVLRIVRLQHLADSLIPNGLIQGEGRSIRLGAGVAHAATKIRVEGEVQLSQYDSILRWLLVNIDRSVLDCKVFACNRNTIRDLLEDQ